MDPENVIWSSRNVAVIFCTVLAVCALLPALRDTPELHDATVDSSPSIEVEMRVNTGNVVELYLNDWEHPPERLPVIARERHVYRFTTLPRNIKVVRLDPSDVPNAEILIYRITVRLGGHNFRQFGPAELKTWTLHNLSPAKEQDGGLDMLGTTDDPILWTSLKPPLRVLESAFPHWYSWTHLYYLAQFHFRLFLGALAALLLIVVVRIAARPPWTELILTALAIELGLWTVLTTANLVRVSWVPVPTGDDWDRWLTYVDTPHVLDWFFAEHIDHRIVAPKLLFEVDHFLFHARGWFTLLCTFCLQTVTAILLWRFSGSVCRQNLTERFVLAAVIATCLFSGQQWVNFVWPFQLVFPLLYCAATVAVYSLWRGAQQEWRNSGRWVAMSIAAATVATYTMANGVLLWPVLLIAAFWLRMPRRPIGALAVSAILFGASYFYHWHKSTMSAELPLAQRLPRAVIFFFAHLGSPMMPLALQGTSDRARLGAGVLPGSLLAVALLVGLVMLWRQRESSRSASRSVRTVLVLYCAFFVGSSMSMAYGRSSESLYEAYTPRYLTPAYVFWVCMLLLAWPVLRRMPRALLYAALCAAMFLGVDTYQHDVLNIVRESRREIPLGEIALVDNVTDHTAWEPLYHTPRIAMDAVDYMREHRLTIFLEEWTHWPGIQIKSRFSIDPDRNACRGEFNQAVIAPSLVKPGWRTTGWAWDVKAGRPPHYVILTDDTGQVAGVALTGFPSSQDAGWTGYVDGLPRPISAYLLEADERSLCSLGTQSLPPSGQEVALKGLGAPLPDVTPQITGAWSQDGYYRGPGIPGIVPVEGRVFGTFPNSNAGTLRLGPFHLDGRTELAIPLVTGPDNHDLSIVVRDADTKEILAKLDPPPIHDTWWAWHPPLPAGREIAVEIYAEDKGSAWLAIGWPHALR